MDSKTVNELLGVVVNKLVDRVLDLEKNLFTLRDEHDRFFKTELLNIRNDISDMKRNLQKR